MMDQSDGSTTGVAPGGSGRVAVLALVAVAALLLATVVAGGVPVDAGLQSGVDADTVLLEADVEPDGDAVWTITYRVRLDTETVTAAFESFQADVQANRSTYEARFAERIRATVASAENATGRSMSVSNVSLRTRTTTVPREYGEAIYRFEWANFAVVDGDRLRVGDALAGFFLDASSSLTITWPTGYDAASVEPPATRRGNGSVTWTGPREFGADGPRVVLAPAGGLPVAVLGVAAVTVIAVAGAGLWWRRRTADEDTEAVASAPASEGQSADEGTTDADDDAGPPTDLMSSEERVLALLEEEGGRIKQQQIAEAFDWTAARTSQVVGDLREDGEVETFRIGRENVVTLPDEEL